MANKKIGEILFLLRTHLGIGQEIVCRGLCSRPALTRYEMCERILDRLLLNALLQRLGKSADKMPTILSEDEYEYFLWKRKI